VGGGKRFCCTACIFVSVQFCAVLLFISLKEAKENSISLQLLYSILSVVTFHSSKIR